MKTEESVRLYGLPPVAEAMLTIRRLLSEEAQKERSGKGRERVEDLALLCCAQLFANADPADILEIWAAKNSGFDLGCIIDIQLLCGPGLVETKAYLQHSGDPAAKKAFASIVESEDYGDFEDFTPRAWLAKYRRYFQVDTSNN